MDYLHEFLFGYYPYIALGVFFIGSLIRYNSDQYSWKASSSQFLSNKGMRIGSNLFHIGIILLFLGHFEGLLVPESIYGAFMTPAEKQMMAMVGGGIFGTICFIGMTILLARRLCNPRIRATSRPSDTLILILIYAQLIVGLATIPASAQHPDGSSMLALANWAQHIATFRPGAADFIVDVHLIFKLHLVLGVTLFLVFPFTRLVHIWSLPIGYLVRKGQQIVRKRS